MPLGRATIQIIATRALDRLCWPQMGPSTDVEAESAAVVVQTVLPHLLREKKQRNSEKGNIRLLVFTEK